MSDKRLHINTLGGDLAGLHSPSTGFDSHGRVAPPEISFSHANDQLAVRAFAIESRLLARIRGDDDGDDNDEDDDEDDDDDERYSNNDDDDEDIATPMMAVPTTMTTRVNVYFAARIMYALYALNDAIVQSAVSSGACSIR